MAVGIMVIDNAESMRELFTFILADQGWQVLSYEYSHTDLAAVQQLNPDLIILDFDMLQGGAGWAFLQLLKMEEATAAIPVLICTSVLKLSQEVEGYLATRNISVVRKPFDNEHFVQKVRETLIWASQGEMTVFGNVTLPILVVEDNQYLREGVASILRLEGYRVVTAANGRLALDAVTHAQYRLILLDIEMPVMNGLEFLAAYEGQPGQHSPVIIVSGKADSVIEIVPSFVIDTLSKPFEIGQLLRLVNLYSQPA